MRSFYSIIIVVILCNSGILSYGQNLEKFKGFKKLKENKPFEYGGSLGVGGSFYNSNSATKRSAPWNWYLSGSPYIKIYGIHIPFTFTYSETGRSLSHPFHYNFSGASPYYKWATLHMGYRSMNFSDYTLAGVVFNGIGVELKPGKWRIGAFYGVFNPAVEADTLNGGNGVILPAYKRTGMGLKAGYGSEKNYFEWSMMRGKDNPESLESVPEFATIKPSENVTFGPKFKVSFLKRWYLESDLALSVFTRNILNDTLPDSEDIRNIYKVVRVNTTTYGGFAGHSSIGVRFDKWSAAFRVRQVSSEYQSMGINLLQDDIREYSVQPSLRLLKGKVNISGSYGFYTDNMSGKRPNQTQRTILNTNLSTQLHRRLNAGITYNNFGTTRTNGQVQMNDSITFSIINESYGVNMGVILGKFEQPVNLSLYAQSQKANDRNIFTQQYNNSQVFSTGANAQYRFKKSKISLSGGGAYASFNAAGGNFQTWNAQMAVRFGLFKNKLNTSIQTNYAKRYQESTLQGDVISANLSLGAKLGKKHQIQTQTRLSRNTTGIISNSAFNEQRISAQYVFTF